MLVFGTRPEAIKMAPLVKEFQKHPESFETIVCVTGQHREMLDQVLKLFEITPDYDLNIMRQGQDLYDVTARVLTGMRDVLREATPDVVLVHGDTTTSTAAALAAFYQQIPVGHIEAGLRTHNIYSPWPEEMNRQMEEISQIRKNFYGTGGEITFLSEIVLNSEYYAAEVERIKELMIGAIGDRNDDLVILYGDQLVETMVGGHVVSRIYVHHVFYDILSAFYSQYGVNDKPRLFESVERLLSYKDGEELEVNFRAVLNEVLAKRTDAAGDSPRIVERIKNIVRDEYRSDIGLEDIAERVNLAPAYLSYLFKKETGANLVKYITDYRMEQARKLLEDEELKIVLVAKACGYENQPYFNRLFKNYYGMTPRQYREKNGKQQG